MESLRLDETLRIVCRPFLKSVDELWSDGRHVFQFVECMCSSGNFCVKRDARLGYLEDEFKRSPQITSQISRVVLSAMHAYMAK